MALMKVVYGMGGYDPTKPHDNAVMWWDLGPPRVMGYVTADGTLVTRPFDASEDAAADHIEGAAQDQDDDAADRDALAAGIAALQGLHQAAIDDAALAVQQQQQVAAARAAAVTQRAAVDAFTPSATYSQQQMVVIRGAVSDILGRLDTVFAGLDEFCSYRATKADVAVQTLAADVAALANLVRRRAL